jgi:hypothetical protein
MEYVQRKIAWLGGIEPKNPGDMEGARGPFML